MSNNLQPLQERRLLKHQLIRLSGQCYEPRIKLSTISPKYLAGLKRCLKFLVDVFPVSHVNSVGWANDQVEARRDGGPLPEKTSTPLPRTSC